MVFKTWLVAAVFRRQRHAAQTRTQMCLFAFYFPTPVRNGDAELLAALSVLQLCASFCFAAWLESFLLHKETPGSKPGREEKKKNPTHTNR